MHVDISHISVHTCLNKFVGYFRDEVSTIVLYLSDINRTLAGLQGHLYTEYHELTPSANHLHLAKNTNIIPHFQDKRAYGNFFKHKEKHNRTSPSEGLLAAGRSTNKMEPNAN